jgi:mono/diheme cytochrome c family protein
MGHADQGRANVAFHFRNELAHPVVITAVTTSCSCTVATLRQLPWAVQPGERGEVTATVDLRGKSGVLHKSLSVQWQGGEQQLEITLTILPRVDSADRLANQRVARIDRQAVFQGDCASCHADPLRGAQGFMLFQRACEICHQPDERRRASMVPSLVGIPQAKADFWRRWITEGKKGSLMPAFGRVRGGPLTAAQIDGLVALLSLGADR